MKAVRTLAIHCFAAACVVASSAAVAQGAQGYPARAITLVVPYTAGGITDATARAVANALSERVGQTVIIDNKPGAGGAIGADHAARAAPDGYTLFFGTRGTQVTNAMIQKDANIPPASAFAGVHAVNAAATVIVANQSAPYKTLQELIDYAKANPNKISYGTAGNGSAAHLTSAVFMDLTGAQMTHVPYKGSAPTIQDLIGGSIELAFDYPITTASFIQDGRLRPLAVLYDERISALPDVPTAAELGVKGAESSSWMGIFAPAQTPRPIIDKLAGAMKQVMEDPEIQKRMVEFGTIPLLMGGKDFDAFIETEITYWSKILDRLPTIIQ